MVNYNDGKWHGWNGGECPVHPETVVEVQISGERFKGFGRSWDWCHYDNGEGDDIIAFRVIKEHKEPREFWISFNQKGEAVDYSEHIDELSSEDGWTCALFREVIE